MTSESARVRSGRPRLVDRGDDQLDPHDQILAAAAELFAERGYGATTTRAIAEKVGIRQASLYYHFAGKDEILLELLETSVRPSLAYLTDLLRHPDPAVALAALAILDVDTLIATPHNIGTLYLSHEVLEPRFESFRQAREALREAYSELCGRIGTHLDADFLGACCLQLVELVITLRRDGEPPASTAIDIAAACLSVVGVSPPGPALDQGIRVAGELRARLTAQQPGESSATDA
ncbi:TetR/AcrR family transcriptional regulator [Amnibacterium flavum]|uniref:TetR family transcriptional regulator n=1 Tax=Amnibacterium flavum TaxID=2173173 RepID=A0A2V1HSR2_9MICO|nr:TetR/AcrR family transcriptional regulator [Amnibacterium flavum]PVZ95371.1 TetR family transcriptional regulator [Amnibacterium flavum]